jgi:hypothetical protein
LPVREFRFEVVLDRLLDSLYTRFILRDVLGNVVPGGLLVVALYLSIFSSTADLAAAFSTILGKPAFSWVILGAAGWFVSFAIQAFGGLLAQCPKSLKRFLPYIDHSERPHHDVIEWHRKMLYFNKVASETDRQQFERLETVKEATGNASLSIILSGIVLAFRFRGWNLTLLVAAALIVSVLLARMHRAMVRVQTAFFDEALKKPTTG